MEAVHLDGYEDKEEVTLMQRNDMNTSNGGRNHNLHGSY